MTPLEPPASLFDPTCRAIHFDGHGHIWCRGETFGYSWDRALSDEEIALLHQYFAGRYLVPPSRWVRFRDAVRRLLSRWQR